MAVVEYTPQAYVPSDLDMFFTNYSPALVGMRPNLVSIDGGYLQYDTKDRGVNEEPVRYSVSLLELLINI